MINLANFAYYLVEYH